MFIELTEDEFVKIVKSKIRKATEIADRNMYNAHVGLLEYYERCKKNGHKVKCYMDNNGSIFAFAYTPEELKIIEKKYRESGIW